MIISSVPSCRKANYGNVAAGVSEGMLGRASREAANTRAMPPPPDREHRPGFDSSLDGDGGRRTETRRTDTELSAAEAATLNLLRLTKRSGGGQKPISAVSHLIWSPPHPHNSKKSTTAAELAAPGGSALRSAERDANEGAARHLKRRPGGWEVQEVGERSLKNLAR